MGWLLTMAATLAGGAFLQETSDNAAAKAAAGRMKRFIVKFHCSSGYISRSHSGLYHRKDCQRRVALQPVVYEQKQHTLVLAGAANQHAHGFACFRKRVLHLAIRRKECYGILVIAPPPQQGPRHQEIGGHRIGNRHLVPQFRHLRPGVIHVGDAVAAQTREVVLFQEFRVADLDRVTKLRRQGGEERVETIEKFRQLGKAAPAKRSEFEDQQRRLGAIRKQRAEKHLLQHVVIEEGFIRFAALRPVARMRRKYLAGDLFGNFEGETKGLRRLLEESAPEILGGELVKREIAAHGWERFGVLAQALGLETLTGKLAARQIALARINLAEPALVLPGTAADINVLGSERAEPRREGVPVEGAGLLEQRTYHARAAR